jgi:FkbM family methyltransferase
MIFPGRCRSILYGELATDPYLIKRIPINDISCFLDIGAAYGITAIHAKLNHTNMKVTCFEPDIRTYEALVNNVADLFIYTHNLALGNGEVFYLAKDRKTPLCNHFLPKSDTCESIMAQSLPLKELVKKARVDINDLWIKVDTEGAERYLFDKDSLDILSLSKIIVMEAHGNTDVGPLEDFVTLLDNSSLSKTHYVLKQRTSSSLMNIKMVRLDYYKTLVAKGISIE